MSNEYVRSFKFGFKLISFVFLLAVPFWLWFRLLAWQDKLSGTRIFSVLPMEIVEVYTARPIGNLYLVSAPGGAQYEVEDPGTSASVTTKLQSSYLVGQPLPIYEVVVAGVLGGTKLYVVTNRVGRDYAEREVGISKKLEEVANSYRDAFSNLPESFNRVPGSYKTISNRKLTILGSFFITTLRLLSSIACLALYFPLVRAIVNLFRKRRSKAEPSGIKLES